MNKSAVGRPRGATAAKVQLRQAVKTSMTALADRAIAGDAKAQERLLEITSNQPAIMAQLLA